MQSLTRRATRQSTLPKPRSSTSTANKSYTFMSTCMGMLLNVAVSSSVTLLPPRRLKSNKFSSPSSSASIASTLTLTHAILTMKRITKRTKKAIPERRVAARPFSARLTTGTCRTASRWKATTSQACVLTLFSRGLIEKKGKRCYVRIIPCRTPRVPSTITLH